MERTKEFSLIKQTLFHTFSILALDDRVEAGSPDGGILKERENSHFSATLIIFARLCIHGNDFQCIGPAEANAQFRLPSRIEYKTRMAAKDEDVQDS
jgi:hypothetical protein